MRYLRHILWLLIRPLTHPFWAVRQQTEAERAEELRRYQEEQSAALQELKLELLLAHRQSVAGRRAEPAAAREGEPGD
jgi:hypothetical protein